MSFEIDDKVTKSVYLTIKKVTEIFDGNKKSGDYFLTNLPAYRKGSDYKV